MENDGVDLSSGPDLSINPRRIVEEPVSLAPSRQAQVAQNPAVGVGLWGTNQAPFPSYTPPQENPLVARDKELKALRDKEQIGASNPFFNFWFEDQAKEKQKNVIDLNAKINENQQTLQTQRTNQALARNMGLTKNLGANAGPADITEEALREWRENGNYDAYRGLQGAGQGARADLYMDEGVNALGKQAEKAQSVINQLDAAVTPAPNQAAYNAVRKQVMNNKDLSGLGIDENNLPKTATEWAQQRGAITAKLNQAKQVVEQFNQKQNQLSQAVPISDEKVAAAVVGNIAGKTGEAFPNTQAVSLPGAGGAQGALFKQPGSKDLATYSNKWDNLSEKEIGVAEKQLNSEQFKGVLGKTKTSKDFFLTTADDNMYTHSAGLAAINDKFGAVERNVAEGSKGSGTIGLTKQLEGQYGIPEHIANATAKSLSEIKQYFAGGSKGAMPKLSQQSIEGIKYVAKATYEQDLKELDRLALPAYTIGYRGGKLEKLGLDKEIQNDPYLKSVNEQGTQQYRTDVDKYPFIVKGDRRVALPQDAKVPGMIPAGSYAATLTNQGKSDSGDTSGTPSPDKTAPAATTSAPRPGSGGGNPPPLNVQTFAAGIKAGESGGNYTATTPGSSAGGAYQFIKSTWEQFKPAGAPDKPQDASPQQQDAAFLNLTQANGNTLSKAGVSPTPLNLAMAHQQGAGGAIALAKAPDDAKALDFVDRKAAANNAPFFWDKDGKPLTVAESKDKFAAFYRTNPTVESGQRAGAAAQTPEEAARYREMLAKRAASATQSAANIAPALGAVAGTPLGPLGIAAGGAAGGAAKQYFNGGQGYPTEMAKGVIGAAPMLIPGVGPASMAARVVAGGASQGTNKAIEGGDSNEVVDATIGGAVGGAIGEGLAKVGTGIFNHVTWNGWNTATQKAALSAAKAVATEEPKIADATGKMVNNPKYTDAERFLKSHGKDPEEVAHNYRAAEESKGSINPSSTGEALVARPAAMAEAAAKKEYNAIGTQIEQNNAALPPNMKQFKLTDGPSSLKQSLQNPNGLPPKFDDMIDSAQTLAVAPAKDFATKYNSLKEGRTSLLAGERDAIRSTALEKTEYAKAARDIADTLRVQQIKIINATHPPEQAKVLVNRLNAADEAYAKAMKVSEGNVIKTIAGGGKEGRDVERAFKSLAVNDPDAMNAMRVLVAAEKNGINSIRGFATKGWATPSMMGTMAFLLHSVPAAGAAIIGTKLAIGAYRYMAARGAGSNVSFATMFANQVRAEQIHRAGSTIGAGAGAQMNQ